MNSVLRHLGAAVLEVVLPEKCPLCGSLGKSPCEVCIGELEPHDQEIEYFDQGALSFRASLYLYRGMAAAMVPALKYARCTSLAHWMASQMAVAVQRLGLQFQAVVPVPIHWSRRAHRGFNQAELLSQSLPNVTGAIARVRRTPPQVGLTREQRLTNLNGAFRVIRPVEGRSVLLIDDVLTSGSTARECAVELLRGGASEVGILTFAGEPF